MTKVSQRQGDDCPFITHKERFAQLGQPIDFPHHLIQIIISQSGRYSSHAFLQASRLSNGTKKGGKTNKQTTLGSS